MPYPASQSAPFPLGRETGVAAGVITHVGQYLGMHHSCAQDLYPSFAVTRPAAGAAANHAVDRHLRAGLDEWE